MADNKLATYGLIFVLVIVGFSLFAALYPIAGDAGDSLGDSRMCTDSGCSYNASRTGGALGSTLCTSANTTPLDNSSCTASGYVTGGFPLATLFAGSGVIFIIIAAAILMFYLKKRQ